MFITIEGVEGSGKTSHILPLARFLTEKGYKVFTTREPGGTGISEQIRSILHNMDNTEMHPRTETLLYQAARAQVVEQVIRPKLKEGYIVLCDRYVHSTIAYQGYGHKQDLTQINGLIEYAVNGLKPDMVLLLDLDAKIGLDRKFGTGEWNRLDSYSLTFHKRVRDGYINMLNVDPLKWRIINAQNKWEMVQDELQKHTTLLMEHIGFQEDIFHSPGYPLHESQIPASD
ncbi:MAG: dTMP kinase [Chloroflexota bacterium]